MADRRPDRLRDRDYDCADRGGEGLIRTLPNYFS
jgi:hypothetical protein